MSDTLLRIFNITIFFIFIITNNACCDSIMLQNQNVSSFQHSYCPKTLPVRSLIYSSVNLRELDPTCWIEAPIEDYLQGGTKEQVNFQVNPATIKHFNETQTYIKEFDIKDNTSDVLRTGFAYGGHGFVNHGTNFLHIEITSPHDLSQSLKLHQKEQKRKANLLKQIHPYFPYINSNNTKIPSSSFLKNNGFINVLDHREGYEHSISGYSESYGFFYDPNLSNNFISLYGYESNDIKLYPPPINNEISCYFFDITGKKISTQNCVRSKYAYSKTFKMYELPNVHVHAKYIKMFPGKTYSGGGKQFFSNHIANWEGWYGKNRTPQNIQNVSHIGGLLYKYTDNAFKEKEVKSMNQPLAFVQKQMFHPNANRIILLNSKKPQELSIASRKLSNVPVPTKLSFLFLKIK